MRVLEKLKQQTKRLKQEIYVLYLAAKDPRTPWYAKLMVAFVVAYAFSPIDLIPDFIPILGYLDDLVLVPLGIMAAIRLVPPDVLAECRAQAHIVMTQGKPVNYVAAVVIVCIWLATAVLIAVWSFRMLAP